MQEIVVPSLRFLLWRKVGLGLAFFLNLRR
jgi:hypothetical protein